MKYENRVKLPKTLRQKLLQAILYTSVAVFISGCATTPDQTKAATSDQAKPVERSSAKSIFVLFDGTKNTPESGTNIWKLYDLLTSSKSSDPQLKAIYIEGVGTTKEPILGPAFGRGMQDRILRGYEFITNSFSPGDGVYILGFSRGAHEARALAGLIAYAGIPPANENADSLRKTTKKILKIVKRKNDKDFLSAWKEWKHGDQPLLASVIHNNRSLRINVRPISIEFVGIWDTVPGSSFKEFGDCKELPDMRDGDRYKSDSYPPIKEFAHAVSFDEKRSKFTPLLLCPAINDQLTSVNEVWFPGAHSDIGGGYEGDASKGLPAISFNWMINALSKHYKFSNSIVKSDENAKGLAHWSIGDKPGNIGSKCADRKPPEGATLHSSIFEREKADSVPLLVVGHEKNMKYPVKCSDMHGD